MEDTPTNLIACLVIINGATSDLGKKFDLAGDEPLTIGRSSFADVSLPKDVYASRAHCTIERTDLGWLVSDLGSLSGTHVDNVQIDAPHLIEFEGQADIKVGDTTLRFIEREPPKMSPDCLVIMTGPQLGKRFVLDRPVTIGSGPGADWLLTDPENGISPIHCRLAPVDDGWQISDLDSVGGTIMEDEVIAGPRLLQSHDTFVLGSITVMYLRGELLHTHSSGCGCILRTKKDGLTGAMTKGYFIREIDAHLEAGEPACAIGLDLVNFRHINDTHGHLVGDRVLLDLANVLVRTLGDRAWICRAGGEEFVVMVPTSSRVVAQDLAETLAAVVEQTSFTYPGVGRLDVRVWYAVAEMREGLDGMGLFSAAWDAVDGVRRAARDHG